MIDLTLLASAFGKSIDLIQKLKEEGNISHTGIIIDYENREAEYRIDITLGEIQSRPNRFKNLLKSLLVKEITIDVKGISGSGIPEGENLVQLNLITLKEKKATIDFPKIFSQVKSSLVVIQIRKSFPQELMKKLLYRNIGRASQRKSNQIISNMDIGLDYANMWYSQFESFTIRNIVFTNTINLLSEAISEALPKKLRNRLASADNLALTNRDARKYLAEFQKLLLEFQSKEFLARLESLFVIEPESNFRITDIKTTMKSYTLSQSGLPQLLPGQFEIKMTANIEDREIVSHGILKFDLDKFQNLLKEVLKKLENKTRKLKF